MFFRAWPTQNREQRSDKAPEKPRPQPTQDRKPRTDKHDATSARQTHRTHARLPRFGIGRAPPSILEIERDILAELPAGNEEIDEWRWADLRPTFARLYRHCAAYQHPTFLTPPSPFQWEEEGMRQTAQLQVSFLKKTVI